MSSSASGEPLATPPDGLEAARGNAFGLGVGARTLTVYAATSLVFAFAALVVELAVGDPLASRHPGSLYYSVADAVWHLATGLALALPTRKRALIVTMPFLSLAIDVDHVFGAALPSVVGRESHDLFFLALVTAVLWRFLGRTPALLGAAATLLHLGVDGGSFPLLAPITTSVWPFPAGVAIASIALSALLVASTQRSLRELARPREALPLVVAVAAIVVVGAFVPWVRVFNGA